MELWAMDTNSHVNVDMQLSFATHHDYLHLLDHRARTKNAPLTSRPKLAVPTPINRAPLYPRSLSSGESTPLRTWTSTVPANPTPSAMP